MSKNKLSDFSSPNSSGAVPAPRGSLGSSGAFWTPPMPTTGGSALPSPQPTTASSLGQANVVTQLGDLPTTTDAFDPKPATTDRLDTQVRLSDQLTPVAKTDAVASGVKQQFFDGPLDQGKPDSTGDQKIAVSLSDAKPAASVASFSDDETKTPQEPSSGSSRRRR